jgi:hypothetical protein
MAKIVRLTEKDITNIVKKVIEEQVGTRAAQGALGGAAFGAGIGSFAGGIGALPGAGVGAAAGGLYGALIGVFEKVMAGGGNAASKVKQIISTCANSKAPVTSQTNKIADMVYDAISGLGTDEDKVYRAMAMPKGVDEFCGVVKSYKSSYKEDLYAALDGDFDSEAEWVMIMRPLRDMVLKSKQQMKSKSASTPQKTTTGGGSVKTTTGGGSVKPR